MRGIAWCGKPWPISRDGRPGQLAVSCIERPDSYLHWGAPCNGAAQFIRLRLGSKRQAKAETTH